MRRDKLSQNQLDFIEKFTVYGMQSGLAKSVARVLSYLVVCQPPKQSAADIQDALGLSAGSVSTATTMLVRVGLVETSKLPGDRHLYYELSPDGFKRSTQQRFKTATAAKEIAADALKSDPGNQRLAKMHQLYATFEKMLSEFLRNLD